MSTLSALTIDNEINEDTDSVGTGGIVDSGLYKSVISLAYLNKSAGGALSLNLTLTTDKGQEIRQRLWMTSGTAKGCLNYYINKRDGSKNYLPGFNAANALAILTNDTPINQLDVEERVISLYSYEERAEVPTQVETVPDLIGKEIIAGVIRQTVDKTARADSGEYLPTGETRDENEVDKFFRASDFKTTVEVKAGAEEASFIETWAEKWKGRIRNRSTGTPGAGTAGVPGKGAAKTTSRPSESIFKQS